MAELVTFPTLGGHAQGQFAAAAAPGPGVLLLPDVDGLAPPLLEAAEQLARAGISALILDLLGGEGSWWGGDLEQHAARFLARDLAEVADDVNAAAYFLLDHPRVRGSRVGVAGADGGGALALWAASVCPRIHTASAAYPARTLWRYEGMTRPQALAGCHTVLHLADDDLEFGEPDTHVLEPVCRGGQLTVHTYPGTGRGFLDSSRPDRYHPAAATLVWERIKAAAATSTPKVQAP